MLTEEDITKYIETDASHFGHGTGSCSMAPPGAEWGTVDPEFPVRGARGLQLVLSHGRQQSTKLRYKIRPIPLRSLQNKG
jgi:hypothetical protein